MSTTSIAIVGGGACGISAFIELFLQLRIAGQHQKVSITIIEQNKEVGKGLAFGTRQPGHILNTQADLMGIHFAEPQHFSEWLIDHENRVADEVVDNQGQDEAFTTRRLYGDYLKEQFTHYFELASREGMQVEVINAAAQDIKPTENGFDVILAGGKKQACHYLILAPGTPVANNYPDLADKKNYFGSPWPSSDILENVPRNENVGILGSSLSAIDALMTLADNAHQGKITFYSLDGLMPRVQSETTEPYDCKYLTIREVHRIQRTQLRNPTMMELFRLFRQEVEHYAGGPIDWKNTTRTGKPADNLLKEDIELAKKGGDALMNVPYALRYESSEMWKCLEESEKLKFKKWLGGHWGVNRHGMPLHNARRIEKLFDDGQLRVIADLHDVSYDDQQEGFVLTYGNDESAFETYLINATGPASAVKAMQSDLMQHILESGLIEPEAAGGIQIDTETMQIRKDGRNYPNLYALGHIANGLLLDVNAVWFNVKTIGTLSQHLVKQICSENPS